MKVSEKQESDYEQDLARELKDPEFRKLYETEQLKANRLIRDNKEAHEKTKDSKLFVG